MCALGLKEADPLHQPGNTSGTLFARAGFSRMLCAPDSDPFLFHATGTLGPCGTPALWNPKAATRATRRSNPAPTSVLQGGNGASRHI